MSRPHTCPTCGGTGQRLVIYTVYTRCESCNGTGIVWEPTTPFRPITPRSFGAARLENHV